MKDLKILDLSYSHLRTISIFDNILFLDIEKIIVNRYKFNDGSLSQLKIFSSIKVESINIFEQKINIKYKNPELDINFNNFNILYEIYEVDKIKVDTIPNNLDIFSYSSFSNKKIPMFKNFKVDSLNINYKNPKYLCEMVFKSGTNNFKINYEFDNLNFMKSDEILSEIKDIKLCNVLIDQNINFQKDIAYRNLKNLELNNCTIETIDLIDQLENKMKNNDLKVISNETKCKEKLPRKKDMAMIEYGRTKLTKDDKIFNCLVEKPFKYNIIVIMDDKYDLFKNVVLTNIEIINFSNTDVNNLDFLTNDTLINLKELYLNNNKIEDISIFVYDQIYFHKLKILDLSNNPIRKGLEVLKKRFFIKCLYVILDLILSELKIIIRFVSPNYNLDIYVNNLSEITNLFEKDKIIFNQLSTEIATKFKEILNLSDEEYEEKCYMYNYYYSSSYYSPFIYSYYGSYHLDNLMTNQKYEYENEGYKQSIIIDNGTEYCKSGFCGEKGPTVIPSCVGYQKNGYNIFNMFGKSEDEYIIGDDIEYKKRLLKDSFTFIDPIKNGVINDWDNMEKIWRYILRTDSVEQNLLLTEPLMNTRENRKITSQIMFETFNIPGLYLANQSELSLYSVGKLTGIVINSGAGVTEISPVFDGYSLPHASISLEINGKIVTDFFIQLLKEEGKIKDRVTGEEFFKNIKEKISYIALDYDKELISEKSFYYELPDGTNLNIDKENFICSEILFKPSEYYKSGIGIDQACNDSIQKCDIDMRKYLYNCIVLSGGNTMFRGIHERLTKEIKARAPQSMKGEVEVIASPERKYAAWIGGSILSSLSFFESMWITKTEYEEYGSTIISRKCF